MIDIVTCVSLLTKTAVIFTGDFAIKVFLKSSEVESTYKVKVFKFMGVVI